MGNQLTKEQSLYLLKQTDSLPSVPALLHIIFSASRDENLNVKSLTDIIKKDQSIVLMIMKSANSAYFNRTGKEIVSLEKAIGIIGISESLNIAMSITLIHAARTEINCVEVDKFWVRSYMTAKTAVYIAKAEDPNQNIIDREELYVTVLLQEIGKVALASVVDLYYFNKEMLQMPHDEVIKLEEKRYGLNYIEAGKYILNAWNIPSSISSNISLIGDYNLKDTKDEREISFQNISFKAVQYVEDNLKHIQTFERAIVQLIPFLDKNLKSKMETV